MSCILQVVNENCVACEMGTQSRETQEIQERIKKKPHFLAGEGEAKKRVETGKEQLSKCVLSV